MAGEFAEAINATRPLLNVRLRYETVDQPTFTENADALTLRVRAGFETGKAWDTSFLIDFDWVESLVGDYNSTTNGNIGFPVVADPQVVELNRIQLTNTSIPGTKVVLGRQRIMLDDSRFVGNVGWRQNEQTFDALRIINTSIEGLTIDVTYLIQVNRIFGDESPMGRFNGDTFLVNASYDFGFGKLTGFAYLIDLNEALANSSKTFGARFAGKTGSNGFTFLYSASIANQTDYRDNPLDYDVMYYAAELGVKYAGFLLAGGWESLGGDGAKGFSTPLATLHKFNGWADIFLGTPANGLEDFYIKGGYTIKDVGPFSTLKFLAFYHWFDPENGGPSYGKELDLMFSATWKNLTFLVKYADYDADTFGVDTEKLWVQLEFKL